MRTETEFNRDMTDRYIDLSMKMGAVISDTLDIVDDLQTMKIDAVISDTLDIVDDLQNRKYGRNGTTMRNDEAEIVDRAIQAVRIARDAMLNAQKILQETYDLE